MQQMWVDSLVWGDPLEKETATHSSILACKIHRKESLAGYRPSGCKELDTTEWLSMHFRPQKVYFGQAWLGPEMKSYWSHKGLARKKKWTNSASSQCFFCLVNPLPPVPSLLHNLSKWFSWQVSCSTLSASYLSCVDRVKKSHDCLKW